ncbi:MAG: GNAT family N-acetyltransferase [Erysipelotrichaceae bacterium]|nr:GNAT family N-acetyltransferase [Erysipelotrichaceae bacterium]
MIKKATAEQTAEIREIFSICFPNEDTRYMDYFFKSVYEPENCYVNIVDGKIVSTLIRNPHAIMFNGRVLQASMIMGVATLPEYRRKGYMQELMDVVLDACEHSELLTLIQSESPVIYEPFGFSTVYKRKDVRLERKDVKRITNFGCAYEPTAIDLLKVYSAFIRRFNGFYARDLQYFVDYKKEIIAEGGKIVAYYNGKDQIQGYAVMIPQGKELCVEEIVYLDSMSLNKLCNAALQERRVIHLHVSEAEDLTKLFPEAKVRTYSSTMARLNDARLFSRLFNKKVTTVEEAYAISQRPLNLNEFA